MATARRSSSEALADFAEANSLFETNFLQERLGNLDEAFSPEALQRARQSAFDESLFEQEDALRNSLSPVNQATVNLLRDSAPTTPGIEDVAAGFFSIQVAGNEQQIARADALAAQRKERLEHFKTLSTAANQATQNALNFANYDRDREQALFDNAATGIGFDQQDNQIAISAANARDSANRTRLLGNEDARKASAERQRQEAIVAYEDVRPEINSRIQTARPIIQAAADRVRDAKGADAIAAAQNAYVQTLSTTAGAIFTNMAGSMPAGSAELLKQHLTIALGVDNLPRTSVSTSSSTQSQQGALPQFFSGEYSNPNGAQ